MKRAFLLVVFSGLLSSLLLWGAGQKAAEATEAKGKVTVMLIRFTEEAVARFQQDYPNIKLEPQLRPFPDIFNHIQVAMQAGSAEPDVYDVDAPLVHQYAYRGWLTPLDDMIPKDLIAQHVESEVLTGTYKGNLVASPWSVAVTVLFYNKQMFRDAGLPMLPEPPGSATWEEIIPMAQKLTKKDASGTVQTWGLVLEQRDRPFEVFNLIGSMGGKYIGDDGLTVKGIMDSDPWIEAFEFYRDIYTKWQVAPNTDHPWSVDMFLQKKAAIVSSGPWASATFFQSDGDIDIGATAFPHFKDGKVVNNCGGWHWGLNSNSKNKAAAVEFLKWHMRPEIDSWLYQTGYGDVGLPSAKSALETIMTDPKYGSYPQRVARHFASVAGEDAIPRALTVGYLEYETIFVREAANIRQGKDIRRALKDAITDIEKEMEKYR